MMQISCSKAYTFFCCEAAKVAFFTTAIKFKEIRSDPESFQKVCLIALAAIQAVNFHCQMTYLPHFVQVLETASAFDFYGFFRLSRLLLNPYSAERLDEYDILNQLESILCHNWQVGEIENGQLKERNARVYQFAKEQLAGLLDKMVKENLTFRTEDEIKAVLHRWIKKKLEVQPQKDFNPIRIHLQALKIKLKEVSWIEAIITYTFVAVDIACVPAFLSQWKLVDFSCYTGAIGRFRLFSWVSHQDLDDWIGKTMCIGYLLHCVNAVHSLRTEKFSSKEAKNAARFLAASLAECLYCLSIIQKRDPWIINYLALIAKSLGLIAILFSSKPIFFNDS